MSTLTELKGVSVLVQKTGMDRTLPLKATEVT